ncbi:DUF6257 family protein [Streptomyces sp. NPDC059740]|uniref:DUF6257 family protein n=1 Tax=Streptomyces sp. NPDC059740 TaxID=3346926 RepID=UPI003660F5DF
MAQHTPPLTAAEKARIAVLVGRMAKRSVAGEQVDCSDLERAMDRILAAARARAEKATRAA